jgi:hypothetical protein
MNADEISLSVTRKQLDDFLDALGEDEEFRKRLVDNPQAALREHGIEVPSELIPGKVVLPEHDHVRHFRRTAEPSEGVSIKGIGIDLSAIDIFCVLALFWRGFQRRP